MALEPLDPEAHAADLIRASADPEIFRYLFEGPFEDKDAQRRWLEGAAKLSDPLFLAVAPRASGAASGIVSYMRMVPEHGVIEIGNIWFGAGLERTAAATETVYLLAKHAFEDLGNRRLEWKTNALNERSRRAALRFGFTFEGIFRQHMAVKGHNRDTAWFSMLDSEWPAVRAAFEAWLDPANFDAGGAQRSPLAARRDHPA